MNRLLAICLLALSALGCTLERPGYRYLGRSPTPGLFRYQSEVPPYPVQELPAPTPVMDSLAKLMVAI